ncbi:MAG: pyridoxamine 5'-phosphate oxidase family protein [Acidiferrobacteraceae bacterium]
MAKFHQALTPELRSFITAQHMFFTGSVTGTGRINVSPKGADTLRILGDHEIAYLDLTGSGAETGAHVRVDGRLTLMFCSFDEKPLILRLYGTATVIARSTPEWTTMRRRFPPLPGGRQIIVMRITSIQTSCGYAVPLFTYGGERDTYPRWAEKKGTAGLLAYQREKNLTSIDGLPTGLVVPDTVDDDDPLHSS